ncbi:MAG: pathogenesis-related family 1 protein [Cyclobacteriaceae bacterium]|nr:pathogenesis-related family 1 protein [Cyclobacteriaceae bacterium HetDA_MAG_MS6]
MTFLLKYFILPLLIASPMDKSVVTIASQEEIKILIERHNYWRAEVGVGPITWSEEMAVEANKWALELKKNCGFYHSKGKYGENLWKGTTGAYPTSYVVDAWGSEKADYKYKSNKCKTGKMCGHYTQIVWKNTTKVGCAKIECDGMTTWVCEYDPPGNWVGQKPY